MAARGLSPSWCTLGEDGAEDSGVAISSMSAYGFPPFLLKALLKELRNCGRRHTRVKEHVTDLTGGKKPFIKVLVWSRSSQTGEVFFSVPFAVGGRAGFQIKSRLGINQSIEMVTARVTCELDERQLTTVSMSNVSKYTSSMNHLMSGTRLENELSPLHRTLYSI